MPYFLRVTWYFCLEVKNLSVYPLKTGFRAIFNCLFSWCFSFAVSQTMVWRMLCQIVACQRLLIYVFVPRYVIPGQITILHILYIICSTKRLQYGFDNDFYYAANVIFLPFFIGKDPCYLHVKVAYGLPQFEANLQQLVFLTVQWSCILKLVAIQVRFILYL